MKRFFFILPSSFQPKLHAMLLTAGVRGVMILLTSIYCASLVLQSSYVSRGNLDNRRSHYPLSQSKCFLGGEEDRIMTSRRRRRVGGGQTVRSSRTPPSVPYVTPVTANPLILSPREQPSRAQTAGILRPQNIKLQTRATTAAASSSRTAEPRWRGRVRPRENIFLPRIDVSRYEPEEDSRFYTTSTACRLGKIHSDAFLIEPSWSSVSRSPWGEAAKVCGGYGKRIVNGTTSRDAPDFIYSKRYEGHRYHKTWKKAVRPFVYRGEAGTAVSMDTPMFFRGQHTQVYGEPLAKIEKPPLIKMMLGKQIIAEPKAVPGTQE